MAGFITKSDLLELLGDEVNCIQFLCDEGLINTEKLCSECDSRMNLKKRADRKLPYFVCERRHKRVRIACTKDTWFENTKMSPFQVMLLTHCFAAECSYKQTVVEGSVGGAKLSTRTITEWFNFCREVCMISMEDKYNSRGKIGGPDHVVEIIECKVGGGKYHRGCIVEGSWILGMIDRNTKEVRMAVCPGNQRDAATLYNLISDHVNITSTIHTDCWRGYNGLMAGGFAAHLTLNHCNHVADPVAGIHTNTIESEWRLLHKRLTRGGIRKRDMDVHIAEYLWRKDCESRNADPFQAFIEDIRKVYPLH